MIKVSFFEPEAFGGARTETMWSSKVGNFYVLENSPFYKYGISYKDIFAADFMNEVLVFTKVIEHCGRSTYRLMLRDGAEYLSPEWNEFWMPLEALGCSFEGDISNQLFAIDIPPIVDMGTVLQLMNRAEEMGFWYFEEGYRYINNSL